MPDQGESDIGNDRNALIAGLVARPNETPAAEEKPAAAEPKPEAKPEAAPVPVETEDSEEITDVDAEIDLDDDSVPTKGLQAIKRAEVRMRQEMALEREKIYGDLKPKLEKLEKLERLQARAKYDPDALAELAALGDDDYEPVSKGLFARSSKFAGKPEQREAAARAMREREQSSKVQTVEQKLADLERQLAERDQQAELSKRETAFLDATVAAVGDKAPLVAHRLTKNPTATREALHQVAIDLAAKFKTRLPKHAEIVAEYEKRRRAELVADGIDPDTLIGKAKAKDEKKADDKGGTDETKTNGATATPVFGLDRDSLITEYANRK